MVDATALPPTFVPNNVRWYNLRRMHPDLAKFSHALVALVLGLSCLSHGLGQSGTSAESLKTLRARAAQGDAITQYNLGVMYNNDEGVARDYAEAVRWYRKAAEQGYAVAQCWLGIKYWSGEGVTQDYAEAYRWIRKSVDQGYAFAQYSLGNMHELGLGVEQDSSQAVRWFREAAWQGEALAQYSLGNMYERGRGVAQDYLQAHMWMNLAASRANGDNQKLYAEARDNVARKMTPAQIAEAQSLAREWKPKI